MNPTKRLVLYYLPHQRASRGAVSQKFLQDLVGPSGVVTRVPHAQWQDADHFVEHVKHPPHDNDVVVLWVDMDRNDAEHKDKLSEAEDYLAKPLTTAYSAFGTPPILFY